MQNLLSTMRLQAETLVADPTTSATQKSRSPSPEATMVTSEILSSMSATETEALLAAKASLEAALWERDLALSDAHARMSQLTDTVSLLTSYSAELAARYEQRDQEYWIVLHRLAGTLDPRAEPEAALADRAQSALGVVPEQDSGHPTELSENGAVALMALVEALRSDLQAAQAAKQELTQTIDERDRVLNELIAAVEPLRQRVEALDQETHDLKTTLAQEHITVADLQANLQHQKEEYEQAIAAKAAEIATLTAGATAAASTIQEKAAALDAAQVQIAKLQQQFDGVPSDILAVTAVTNRVTIKRAALTAALLAGAQPALSPHPQDLSQIDGIGDVFEKRLFAAGIGSFWEVANLSNDDFERALQLDDLRRQSINLEAIRADALKLVGETNTLGRIWEGQPLDDFDAIKGMGTVFEQKLYAAGIYTYADLATLTVEQLTKICRAPRLRIPDYAGWITQAQQLLAEQPPL